jgi:hypothetical protein
MLLMLLMLAPAIGPQDTREGDDGSGGPMTGVGYGKAPTGVLPGTRANGGAFDTTDTARAAAGGSLESDCDLQFLQGNGGGHMELTVTGTLAKLLRYRLDDPWYRYGGNLDGVVRTGDIDRQDTEGGAFAEAFEDRLEGTSNIFIDLEPVDFDSRFKGMDLRRDEGGGVDVRRITGLSDAPVDSADPVLLSFDIKGSITGANRDILLSDGYVMVYALFGEEFNVTYREDLRITTVGFSSLQHTDGDAYFSTERSLAGLDIHYRDEYVTGAGKKGDGVFKVYYTGFSPVYSPPLLVAYLAATAIILILAHRWFRNRSDHPRNLPFILVASVLLTFLACQYRAGLDAPLYLVLLFTSAMFLVGACRLIYPPSPEVLGGMAFRPMATGSLVGPGHRGGMSKPSLQARESAEEGASVLGWEMIHRSAHQSYAEGDLVKTLELLEAGLNLDPANHMLLNDKGFVLLRLGRHEEALEHFKKALKAEPDYTIARANITQCLIEKDL